MINMGERLKNLRIKNNLTQQQLAELIGLANSAISSYESGYRYPSYDVLIKYTHIFHVSSDYILGLDSKNTVDVSDLSKPEVDAVIEVINVFRKVHNS
ncbi:MAG: helix-turn-helix domain-containing protein [Butyrivibrio sp.]